MLSWVRQVRAESEEVGFFFSSQRAVPVAQDENDQAADPTTHRPREAAALPVCFLVPSCGPGSAPPPPLTTPLVTEEPFFLGLSPTHTSVSELGLPGPSLLHSTGWCGWGPRVGPGRPVAHSPSALRAWKPLERFSLTILPQTSLHLFFTSPVSFRDLPKPLN